MQFGRLYRRVAAAGVLIALATPSTAGALAEQEDDPVITETTIETSGSGDAVVMPLSDTVAEVEAGESRWIAINWTSLHADARELKVTATGSEGVVVEYPAFPVDGYSSGYWDDTLTQSETDFTALKVTVRETAPSPRSLAVTVSWVSDSGAHSETFDMPFGSGDFIDGGAAPTSAPPTSTPSTAAAPTIPPTTASSPTTTPTTAAPTTAPPTTAPPTTAPPTTAPPTTDQTQLPEVLSFKLVDTENDVDIRPLVDGDIIDIGELGDTVSVVAIANDVTESVRFFVNGRNHRTEQFVPYAIAGDIEGDYGHWKPKPDVYEIEAVPFSEDRAAGITGIAQTITITVVD